MDAIKCIKTRRSHRRFLDQPIPDDVLTQIVEAGQCAPSGGNSQSFHFIVVTNREIIAKLADMVQAAYAPMEARPGMYGSLINSINQSKRGDYVFHYAPPAFIIVANQITYPNAMADSACALQNMMLAANALDLGSCWINQLRWLDKESGMTGEHPELADYLHTLGLEEGEMVCGALSVGYVEKLNRMETPRKSKVTIVK